MKGLDLHDIINTFRAMETNEDAIPVLGDEDAMRVLAAWRKTDQSWSKPRTKMPAMSPSNHGKVWRWLCSGWALGVAEVAEACGLSVRSTHEKLRMLQALRLIYPDGQISKPAQTALQLHVASKLKGLPKRQSKKPDGETN